VVMRVPPVVQPASSCPLGAQCLSVRRRPHLRRRLRLGPHPRQFGSEGFSLVEVLVATGLLITSVMSLAQLFVLATRANAAAGEMTEATILAVQKVEELRAAPLPNLLGSQSIDYVDSRGERLGSATSNGRRAYARRWWIESPAAGTEAVAVTVVVSRYRRGDGDLSDSGGLPGAGTVPGETGPQEIVRVVTLRTLGAGTAP
jgi:type II secretory pathway pseudopilin PulG